MKTRLEKILSITLLIAITTSMVLPVFMAFSVVEPSELEYTLYEGESVQVTKYVTTPTIPPKLDLLLLEDESGSFGDDIETMKGTPPLYEGLAMAIWDGIDPPTVDLRGAVAGFVDFPLASYGGLGDWPYRLIQDFTNDRDTWKSGIIALTLGWGNDEPESQLEGLMNAVSLDWREDATKIVLLVTDAPYHDSAFEPAYPGPSYADTVAALDAEGIHVIVLSTATSGVVDLETFYQSLVDDTGGVWKQIQPDSSDIVEAVFDALEAILTDVWYEVGELPEGVEVSLTPTVEYGVPGDTTVEFEETIIVTADASPGTYEIEVTFFSNSYPEEGSEIGTQTIILTIEPHEVDIDIKPNSDPNAMNPQAKGVIPVAILTTEDFDASLVDHETVRFGPDMAAPVHNGACGHLEDYDLDGDLDAIYHFNIQDTGIVKGDTMATLTGKTVDGIDIKGTDSVKTAGK